jgi:hypothetical protein
MKAAVVAFDDHTTRAHIAAPTAVPAVVVMTLDHNRLRLGGTNRRRSETNDCQASRLSALTPVGS